VRSAPADRVRELAGPGVPLGVPPDAGVPVLQVDDLSVAYQTRRGDVTAVDGVSFDLARGEFLGIVGESGCGKSTLLFAIAQLLAPPAQITGGCVSFKGTDLTELTERQLAAIRWKELSVVMQSAMNALNPVKSDRRAVRTRCGHTASARSGRSPSGRPRCWRWSASTRAPEELPAPAVRRNAPAFHDRDGPALHP
jgi:ABC-type dipeptide/oligopeptide/nickel transport system ATPase subunit